MLASWMLYCVAIGVLLSTGAVALERGLRSLGRPTRWAWAGASALTLAIPIAAWTLPATPLAPGSVGRRIVESLTFNDESTDRLNLLVVFGDRPVSTVNR